MFSDIFFSPRKILYVFIRSVCMHLQIMLRQLKPPPCHFELPAVQCLLLFLADEQKYETLPIRPYLSSVVRMQGWLLRATRWSSMMLKTTIQTTPSVAICVTLQTLRAVSRVGLMFISIFLYALNTVCCFFGA